MKRPAPGHRRPGGWLDPGSDVGRYTTAEFIALHSPLVAGPDAILCASHNDLAAAGAWISALAGELADVGPMPADSLAWAFSRIGSRLTKAANRKRAPGLCRVTMQPNDATLLRRLVLANIRGFDVPGCVCALAAGFKAKAGRAGRPPKPQSCLQCEDDHWERAVRQQAEADKQAEADFTRLLAELADSSQWSR